LGSRKQCLQDPVVAILAPTRDPDASIIHPRPMTTPAPTLSQLYASGGASGDRLHLRSKGAQGMDRAPPRAPWPRNCPRQSRRGCADNEHFEWLTARAARPTFAKLTGVGPQSRQEAQNDHAFSTIAGRRHDQGGERAPNKLDATSSSMAASRATMGRTGKTAVMIEPAGA